MKLRQINLQLTEVVKAYPNVAALLNYNTSINMSTTVVSRASELSTKVDDVQVKEVHEPAVSEGNTIHTVCTTIITSYQQLSNQDTSQSWTILLMSIKNNY